MIQVLFVCLGNICRSPMAEAIFRHNVKEARLGDTIVVDSAGTGEWHVGKVPHEGTCHILNQHRIDYRGIVARQVQKDDLQRFDYVIAMDAENEHQLCRMANGNETGKIAKLLDFVPDCEMRNVPDPFFTGNFGQVYRLVEEGCDRLLAHIRRREGL